MTLLKPRSASPPKDEELSLIQQGARGVLLVWETSPHLIIFMAILMVIAGIIPAGIAWIGKELSDTVVAGVRPDVMRFLWIDACFLARLAAVSRAQRTALS